MSFSNYWKSRTVFKSSLNSHVYWDTLCRKRGAKRTWSLFRNISIILVWQYPTWRILSRYRWKNDLFYQFLKLVVRSCQWRNIPWYSHLDIFSLIRESICVSINLYLCVHEPLSVCSWTSICVSMNPKNIIFISFL